MKGYIHSIETFGTVDGPGMRYVIFLQGCFFRCLYCHNPDTWMINSGKKMSINEIVSDVKKYINYIKYGGVTLSGGEPLLQAKFVYKLVKKLKKLGIHIAIDTAGSVPLKISKKIIDNVDLVLLDVKSLNNDLHKKITGCFNDNTLKTLSYCEQIQKTVWVRYVVVPGLTDSIQDLEELADFLKNYKCVKNVEIIPFHKMGEYKWKELGVNYELQQTIEPSKTQIENIKLLFKNKGLNVK